MHISCNVVLLPYYKQIKYLFDSTSWHRHRRCPSDPPSKPITSHLSSLPPHPYRRRGDGAFPSRMQRPRHQSKVCDSLTDRRRHNLQTLTAHVCVGRRAPKTTHKAHCRPPPLQTPPRASKWPQRPSQVSERVRPKRPPNVCSADRPQQQPPAVDAAKRAVRVCRALVGRSVGRFRGWGVPLPRGSEDAAGGVVAPRGGIGSRGDE